MDSIRALYGHPGPWASVYLDVSRAGENAAHQVELRWRAARERLLEAGADEATLAALEDAILDPARARPGGTPGGLALFATGGRLVLTAPTAAPPAEGEAHWSALPHITPLLADGGERVRWLRAVVDRTGADLESAAAGTLTVAPAAGYPISKNHPGGWSQSRYQRAAETTWKRNQRRVAERLERLATETGAEVVIVAGEVRARQLLLEQLTPALLEKVVETDAGSRAADGDNDEGPLDAVSAEAVRAAAERRRTALLDTYGAGLGTGLCADGLAEVVPAAQESRISALLVNRDIPLKAVWVDPAEPVHVALDRADLSELGIEGVVREPAGDALVAAAMTTGANLMVIDREEKRLTDGVGAILRYPLPDPQAS